MWSVAKFLQSTRPIAIDDDIGGLEELFEALAAGRAFKVQLAGMFSRVAVYLEEGDVGEMRRSHFQDRCAIFSKCASDGRACDDAAELKNSNARKRLGFARREAV